MVMTLINVDHMSQRLQVSKMTPVEHASEIQAKNILIFLQTYNVQSKIPPTDDLITA